MEGEESVGLGDSKKGKERSKPVYAKLLLSAFHLSFLSVHNRKINGDFSLFLIHPLLNKGF